MRENETVKGRCEEKEEEGREEAEEEEGQKRKMGSLCSVVVGCHYGFKSKSKSKIQIQMGRVKVY